MMEKLAVGGMYMTRSFRIPEPEVIKLFSCSTQLCTKFQLLIKDQQIKKKFLALSLPDVVLARY